MVKPAMSFIARRIGGELEDTQLGYSQFFYRALCGDISKFSSFTAGTVGARTWEILALAR